MAEIRIIRNFISERERALLERHALDLFEHDHLKPNPSGPHRFYLSLRDSIHNNELIEHIGAKVRKIIAFDEVDIDNVLGWIVSYIEPQGFVHPHRDSSADYEQPGCRHIRGNVVVRKNADSGNPIINNTVYRVSERDLWIFCACEDLHACQPVAGPKPRIVYQFGFAAKIEV